MKPIKYLVLDDDDFKHNCVSLDILYESLIEAKEELMKCTIKGAEIREDLSHQDIDIDPIIYHIYKVERVD